MRRDAASSAPSAAGPLQPEHIVHRGRGRVPIPLVVDDDDSAGDDDDSAGDDDDSAGDDDDSAGDDDDATPCDLTGSSRAQRRSASPSKSSRSSLRSATPVTRFRTSMLRLNPWITCEELVDVMNLSGGTWTCRGHSGGPSAELPGAQARALQPAGRGLGPLPEHDAASHRQDRVHE